MYTIKHNYILGGMLPDTKTQLHVSAINVGHLQVVHEELINKLYKVCGEFTVCGVEGCEIWFCVGERGVDWGCLGIVTQNDISHPPTPQTVNPPHTLV